LKAFIAGVVTGYVTKPLIRPHKLAASATIFATDLKVCTVARDDAAIKAFKNPPVRHLPQKATNFGYYP